MADKTISELVAATQVYATDLFVLEQNSIAKKLTGQILENWLVALADGHGGIQTVTKTGTVGLVDTYTITYADTTTSTFTVTNGQKGDTGNQTYVWIKYSNQQPTRDQDIYDTPDNWMGIYAGLSSTAPTTYTSYLWFKIKGETGATGTPASVSSTNIDYQASTSGTVVPTGTWSATVPVVAQGQYLWTRTKVQFNTGNPITYYSVGRMGMDGTGSVRTVNELSPDSNGNVQMDASDINVDDSAAEIVTIADKFTSQSSQIESLNTTVGQHTTAIANKSDKATSFTVTLDADDWNATTNTLTITDARFVVDGFDYVVTPTSASYKTYGESQICAYDVTVASSMTFHAETIPEDDLVVNVMKVVVSA